MNILARMMRAVRRRNMENPNTPLNDPDDWLFEALGGRRSLSGIAVNSETSLTYSPVWRGVNLLAGDVGKLPLVVYVRDGDGKAKAVDHPAYQILRYKPNREMTAFVFKRQMMRDAILDGNGIAYISRAGNGDPVEVIPLHPTRAWPVRENGILWYVVMVGDEMRRVPPEDILHIKGLGYDGLSGYPLWMKAKDSWGGGMAAQRYGARYFRNAARPDHVIEHPGTMSEAALNRLKRQWDDMHAGLDNAHKTAILEEGMKLNPLSNSAKDAQLLEMRQFEVREVANWLGVPPHKLGDSSRTSYNSLEQENQAYLDEALDQWLVNWEEECRDKLLRESEKDADSHVIEFTRQALLRADLKTRMDAYAVAIQNRIMSPNEARSRENLNPYEGGDQFLVPSNMGAPSLEGNFTADPIQYRGSAELVNSTRSILEATAGRMLRRIGTHARRAASKNEMFAVSNEDRTVFIESMLPAVRAYIASLGLSLDAGPVVTRLLDILDDDCGKLKPDAVEAYFDRIEGEWPANLPDQIRAKGQANGT